MLCVSLPDCDDFTDAERDAIHLGYENGGDSFVQRRTVHINCGTNCNDEPRHTAVYLVVLFQAAECNGQGGSTVITSFALLSLKCLNFYTRNVTKHYSG